MPNHCLSVLYKRIIQVENKNVGLKVGGGAQTYHCPPNQKSGGAHAPLAPPPPPLPTPVLIYNYLIIHTYIHTYIQCANLFSSIIIHYTIKKYPGEGWQ